MNNFKYVLKKKQNATEKEWFDNNFQKSEVVPRIICAFNKGHRIWIRSNSTQLFKS